MNPFCVDTESKQNLDAWEKYLRSKHGFRKVHDYPNELEWMSSKIHYIHLARFNNKKI